MEGQFYSYIRKGTGLGLTSLYNHWFYVWQMYGGTFVTYKLVLLGYFVDSVENNSWNSPMVEIMQ